MQNEWVIYHPWLGETPWRNVCFAIILFEDNACGCVRRSFAKGVEGKEKDVSKSYLRDAGGFVGWDYTSEENTST